MAFALLIYFYVTVTNFLKGFSARSKLLDGAIPVELTPRVANFEKHADSNKMLNDFYSVHPVNVRNNMVSITIVY